MFRNVGKRSVSVTLGILQLLANLANAQSNPPHADRRQMPRLMPGNAAFIAHELDILGAVTRRTMQAWRTETTLVPSDDRRIVGTHIITLPWQITNRMTVHAAWTGDDFRHFIEQGLRAFGPIFDAFEVIWTAQVLRRCLCRQNDGRCDYSEAPAGAV